MKRMVSAAFAAFVVLVSLAVAAPASAWDSGGGDGSQPIISGDNFTTCAVRESGAIYCWGGNGSAQLGRGTGTAASLVVAPVASSDSSLALSVSVNNATACAVMLGRTVKCWGYGATGVIGDGNSSAAVDTPTTTSGLTGATAVSVGFQAVCASRQDGSVWCWGTPGWGTFGGFPAGIQTSPVKVTGVSSITDVSVGQFHACALRADKHVVCWGDNSQGQLGNGTNSPTSGVSVVSGITDATAVVTGWDNTCAVRTGGTVYCWGNNSLGALGSRSAIPYSTTPIQVYGLSGVTSLAMQGYGGCAVAAGVVKCWGSNDLGRIGDGQFVGTSSPVRSTAASLPNPTAAWTSYWGSCEIADGGRVWCWGNGAQGRLGNGSTASSYTGTGPGDAFGYADTPSKVRILSPSPGKPTGSSTSAKKIRITWTAPSTAYGTSAPTDYVIKYRLKGTTTWKTFADPVTSTRVATVTGLTSGKYYQFEVYPKNWAGTGTVSAISSYIKSR